MPPPTNPSPVPQRLPSKEQHDETCPLSKPAVERSFAPADRPGEVGQLGRYRVLKNIGQGGMGAVYLGFDGSLHRQVALKVMLPEYAANRSVRERFLREARL